MNRYNHCAGGRVNHFIVIGFVALAASSPMLAGCGDNQQSAEVTAPASDQGTASPAQVRVTKTEYGDKWPLTVDEANLINKDNLIYLEIKGVSYAANGIARDQATKDGTPDIMKSPYLNQDKAINLLDLIQRGLALKGQ